MFLVFGIKFSFLGVWFGTEVNIFGHQRVFFFQLVGYRIGIGEDLNGEAGLLQSMIEIAAILSHMILQAEEALSFVGIYDIFIFEGYRSFWIERHLNDSPAVGF